MLIARNESEIFALMRKYSSRAVLLCVITDCDLAPVSGELDELQVTYKLASVVRVNGETVAIYELKKIY